MMEVCSATFSHLGFSFSFKEHKSTSLCSLTCPSLLISVLLATQSHLDDMYAASTNVPSNKATDFSLALTRRRSKWDPNNSPGCFARAGHKQGKQLVSSVTSFNLHNPRERGLHFYSHFTDEEIETQSVKELSNKADSRAPGLHHRLTAFSVRSQPHLFIRWVNVFT